MSARRLFFEGSVLASVLASIAFIVAVILGATEPALLKLAYCLAAVYAVVMAAATFVAWKDKS
jgi:hypothetical protein